MTDRPLRRLAALLLALAGVGGSLAAPARAQEPSPTPTLELQLLGITPSVGPERPLGLRLRVRNPGGAPLRDLVLRVYRGSIVQTRSQLLQRLTSPPPQGVLIASRPLEGLEVGPGQVADLPPQRVDLPEGLGTGGAGAVVAMHLEVQAEAGGDQVEDAIDTWAVFISEQVANPLQLSLLVPMTEPTHRTPDKVFVDSRLGGTLSTGGSLGRIAAELAAPDRPPLSLVVDPLLVEEAAAMAANEWPLRGRAMAEPQAIPGNDPRSLAAKSFLDNLRLAASRPGVPLTAFPYANGDLTALVRHGLEADVLALIGKGRRDLEAALGTTPDERLAWPAGGAVDAPTLKTLGLANVRGTVISHDLLPVDSPWTQNAPVRLDGGTSQPGTALVPDASLSAAVADPRGATEPAVLAQRVLAETAVAWLERPGGTNPTARGVLIAPPQSWRPAPGFFSALLDGLGEVPWLDVVPAHALLEGVPPGPDDQSRALAPYGQALTSRELPGAYLARISEAKRRLTSFQSTVGPGYAPVEDFTRNLYVAESTAYRRPTPRSRGVLHIRAVNEGIVSVYDRVRIQGTQVTLTRRDGNVPVSVTNSGDEPLTVRLRLTSPRVEVPQHVSEPFVIGGRSGATIAPRVRTRATGRFPVTAEVLSADGRVIIARDDVQVRSTAISRVTLVLMGGSLAFLLVWWGRKNLGRGRRPQPPRRRLATAATGDVDR
jgi:hypothetical protein